jgi:hypothetical protein
MSKSNEGGLQTADNGLPVEDPSATTHPDLEKTIVFLETLEESDLAHITAETTRLFAPNISGISSLFARKLRSPLAAGFNDGMTTDFARLVPISEHVPIEYSEALYQEGRRQKMLIRQRQEELTRRESVDARVALQDKLDAAWVPAPATHGPIKASRIRTPDAEEFHGDGSGEKVYTFIEQLSVKFYADPQFELDTEKIRYAGMLLKGSAFAWFMSRRRDADQKQQEPFDGNFASFIEALKDTFGDAHLEERLGKEIYLLKQTATFSEHLSAVNLIRHQLGWPWNTQLLSWFLGSLRPELQREVGKERPPLNMDDPEATIKRLVLLDRTTDYATWRPAPPASGKRGSSGPASTHSPAANTPATPVAGNAAPKPTTSGEASERSESGEGGRRRRVTAEEKKRRRDNGLCAYCGSAEHSIEWHNLSGQSKN